MTKQAGMIDMCSGLRPAFFMRPLTSAQNAWPAFMLGSAVNTISAVSAASWRPTSEAPACTITGQPCTGRAMLSGPFTERYFPLWSSTCILSGSKKMPLSTSRMKASSAQRVPQPGDDVIELAGAPVALVMLHVLVHAEVQRGIRDSTW